MQGIDRRYGKVTPFDAGPMADVNALALRTRIPGGFRGIDLVRRRMHVVDIPDVVENEEFVLGSEKSLISDTRGLEVLLSQHKMPEIRRLVCFHKNCSVETLTRLFNDGDEACRNAAHEYLEQKGKLPFLKKRKPSRARR